MSGTKLAKNNKLHISGKYYKLSNSSLSLYNISHLTIPSEKQQTFGCGGMINASKQV